MHKSKHRLSHESLTLVSSTAKPVPTESGFLLANSISQIPVLILYFNESHYNLVDCGGIRSTIRWIGF